jgi:hypothetical protein
MPSVQLAPLARQYRESHRRALALVEALSDEEVAWRPAPRAPSIGWNLWQMARLADHFQASLSRLSQGDGLASLRGRLIWEAEGLAVRWGLEPDSPDGGRSPARAAGTEVLALPGKGALLDYAQRAFAAAEQALDEIAARETPEREAWHAPPAHSAGLDFAIAESLAQENRCLGALESVRRLQGLT